MRGLAIQFDDVGNAELQVVGEIPPAWLFRIGIRLCTLAFTQLAAKDGRAEDAPKIVAPSSAALPCARCSHSLATHCHSHTPPCCPGQCPDLPAMDRYGGR